jgi:hypothetical protein
MKKGLFVISAVMVLAFFMAGITTTEAQAFYLPPLSPAEFCNMILDSIGPAGGLHPDSHYDAAKQQCIIGFEYSPDTRNMCFPKLDVIQFYGGAATSPRTADVKGEIVFIDFVGCFEPHQGPIKDPNQGSVKLGDGISFSYERKTCAGSCSITKFGLTGVAKRDLGSVPGKVIGKTYVQIWDGDKTLTSGDFTLCMYAKGAKNPYFFRWAGKDNWQPMGGYWKGDNFCMAGSYSGNYVLANMP